MNTPSRRRVVALTATITATLITTSCGGGGEGDRPRTVARVVGPFEIHSLEPTASSGLFTRLEVAETLVSSDVEGTLAPGLATTWRPSADKLTWTFGLVDGASFHDGTPVDAGSVARSLTKTAADAASPLASAPIKAIAPVGEDLTISLTTPDPTVPALLTHYSAGILAPSSYDGEGRVTKVVGSGPFEISQLELPSSITTRRFADYRGAKPAIEGVEFSVVGRAETRAVMAASGQADVVFGLEPAGRQRVDAAEGVSMASALQPRTVLLKINDAHPALKDIRVRHALSLMLDRERIAEAVLRERDLAATQLFPPALATWNQPNLEPLTQDVERARALLAEAGFNRSADGTTLEREGKPLRLTLTTYPDRPELPPLATAIQEAARAVGITIDVAVGNSSEIPAKHADGTLELALLTKHFALVSDPYVSIAETFAPGGAEWGVMNWEDPALTAALSTVAQQPTGPAADAARREVASIIQEQLPVVPVAWYRFNAAVSDRLDGFVIDPIEHSWRLSETRWAP
ncbi:ABC transporter substrate-binding protein [Knoellia sp. CPCC 206453]|uniref:ABC transporter substrate-binding protein n=1 Tax=Knoellia pratensis TaxID=3404796 RepID=UPI00361F2148